MVTVDEAVIARLEKRGKTFEVLVDPELAFQYKHNPDDFDKELIEILAVNQVYSDSKKGSRASEADIKEVFGNADIDEIVSQILKQGTIQMTTELKRIQTEKRKKEIASMIARNALDPKSRLPHPMSRVLNAMEQARVNINLTPAESQVNSVVKQIQEILPLSFEKVKMKILVPARYTGKAYGYVKNTANILNDEWCNDGCWMATIEVTAGLKMDLIDNLNHMTKGEVEIKEVN
jgi:ribosome maturation protein SDO1